MASKKQETTALAETPKNQALGPVADYGDYAGKGFENQDSADVGISFLNILQALSPQVQPDGIPGAKAGMIFNTVTEELIDGEEGVLLVPVSTLRSYVEWRPREAGGGYRGQHRPEDPVVIQALKESTKFGKYQVKRKVKDDKGNEVEEVNDLVETFYVWCLIVDETDKLGYVCLSLSSTKIKPYKKWMGKVHQLLTPTADGRKINPPLFAHCIRLKTKMERNAKNQPYFNFAIEPANNAGATTAMLDSLLSPSDVRFTEAVKFAELVEKGLVKTRFDKSAGGAPAGGGASSEDSPF